MTKRLTVTLALDEWTSGQRKDLFKTVRANAIFGVFAVHRSLGWDGEPSPHTDWQITHVPSGRGVSRAWPTMAEAVRIARIVHVKTSHLAGAKSKNPSRRSAFGKAVLAMGDLLGIVWRVP